MMTKSQRAWFITGVVCTVSGASFAIFEPWDTYNDPANFDSTYERTLSNLPTSGEVERLPWSDTYWPAIDGGIANRWKKNSRFIAQEANSIQNVRKFFPFANDVMTYKPYSLEEMLQHSPKDFADLTSPIERFGFIAEEPQKRETGTYFDRLLGWERNYLNWFVADNGGRLEGWEGLCNGWSVASILHQEPERTVYTRTDLDVPEVKVAFHSSDIKALLMTFYQRKIIDFFDGKIRLNYQTLGVRCGNQRVGTSDAFGAKWTNPCGDMNAGTFHLVIANEIGIRKKSFIMDLDNTPVLWNHPIVAYSYGYDGHPRTKEVYRFKPSRNSHPETQYEVRVILTMKYQQETLAHSKALGDVENRKRLGARQYVYRLEIGRKGEILGGTWESQNFPDFAWRMDKVPFDGDFVKLKELVSDGI